MELRQLEFVLAVAEQLSFGRAAEALHVGPSTVSQQVARLEQELGQPLFTRAARTVQVTAAGARFVGEARAVLAAVERARASVAGEAAPTMRIGTTSGLGDHLTDLLAALERSTPELRVELRAASTRTRLDQVRAGQLDAAFVRGEVAPADLEVVPAWADELVIALPLEHPLASMDPVPLAMLLDVPLRLVSRELNQPLVDLVLSACARAGFEPSRRPAVGPIEETLAAIGAGEESWAILYGAQAKGVDHPRIAFRRIDPPLSMPTACVFSPSAGSAAVAPLLEAVRQLGPG